VQEGPSSFLTLEKGRSGKRGRLLLQAEAAAPQYGSHTHKGQGDRKQKLVKDSCDSCRVQNTPQTGHWAMMRWDSDNASPGAVPRAIANGWVAARIALQGRADQREVTQAFMGGGLSSWMAVYWTPHWLELPSLPSTRCSTPTPHSWRSRSLP